MVGPTVFLSSEDYPDNTVCEQNGKWGWWDLLWKGTYRSSTVM
jgi:hypothetical protein